MQAPATWLPAWVALLALAHWAPAALSQAQPDGMQPVGVGEPGEGYERNYPFYIQSPVPPASGRQRLIEQRATLKGPAQVGPAAAATVVVIEQPSAQVQPQPPAQPLNQPVKQPLVQPPQQQQQPPPSCLYDRRHFARFDQCLERKPYPTIGLPAFKNEDLMPSQRSTLSDKHGCSFLLTNGLFKHYQISKYASDSGDSKCLDDGDKLVQLSMQFSNVTLYYLWQLRCLNYANQLLDDATLNGKSSTIEFENHQHHHNQENQREKSSTSMAGNANSICVGSSQNFGFSSLQVSHVEAQVELAMDIYKNWRITNITLAMLPSSPSGYSKSSNNVPGEEHLHHHNSHHEPSTLLKSTGIRDFTFQTLDGDELNWRYLNLYENWTRNRLHTNFLEQFKRFVWISLQRCLSESSEKLPVKLVELFGQQKFNQ